MLVRVCDECGKPAVKGNSMVLFEESTSREKHKFSWYGVLHLETRPEITEDEHHICTECAIGMVIRGLKSLNVVIK